MKNLIARLTFFQPIRMLHFEEFSTKLGGAGGGPAAWRSLIRDCTFFIFI
jgi:hypothetical protein